MEELAEGEVLADRYLLGPVVGHGAMGQVCLAEDLRLMRPVAIKSLRPELARHPDVRQRFGQEARAAARISHPNVVRVYDSGEQGRIPYLVMECLPGSTLADELAWGPLELLRARRVGLDVLGALEAAHRLGIVHRDVKPGNILLSAVLDGPVKVSDFGIAKSAADRNLTDSGSLVGTAGYLSPERVAGDPAGPRSDLYSLGVVLYEAIAGRKPYEGETSLAVALAIHIGGAPRLLELQPDVDPAFADVVDRAIARHPSDRWSSAIEMGDALRAWRPAAGGQRPASTTRGQAAVAPTSALPAAAAVDAAVDPPGLAAGAGGPVPLRGGGDGAPGPRWRRSRIGAVCAGVGALLLVAILLGVAGRRSSDGTQPVSPPTTAETVAAAAPTTGPATVPSTAPSTVPSAKPSVTPSTAGRRPATTATAAPRAPVTTAVVATTRAPTTTTRPPPTTSAPSTTPTSAPAALTAAAPGPASASG